MPVRAETNNTNTTRMKAEFLDIHGITPEKIPAILSEYGIEYTPVRCVNWPETYPDCPDFKFGIAYSEEGILIHYKVTECLVRAVTGHDFGPVWEDSCAEFFFSPGGSGVYYNVECNCIGSLHVAVGAGRNDREKADPELVRTIRRWTSLGDAPFGEKNEKTSWETALIIPWSIFWKHHIDIREDIKGTANVYECQEGGHPHFISLYPIDSEKPDFHRPEFFREIIFSR